MHHSSRIFLAGLLPLVFAIACSDEDNGDQNADASVTLPDATADAGASDLGVVEVPDAGQLAARCTDPVEPACQDEQVQGLVLYSDGPSTGAITQESLNDNVFTTYIDARGGGLSATESFVYAKFTNAGLQKVEINDDQAFSSMDWDIAFRRYLIRVNSGVSGPSCVLVARDGNNTDFDSVTAVPDGLTYNAEQYYTEATCTVVEDGSGLPGSAATALSAYWRYSMCLQMTDYVFIVQLADGHSVKLTVLNYYNEPGAQDTCDTTGSAPMPSGSAQFRIKWAYIE
jgi:hypothetical protein